MPRYSFRQCKQCFQLHETGQWPEECLAQFEKKRSHLPMPAIRTDGMEATMNHADGKTYDSRSAYERAVKDAGCVIVGNDQPAERQITEVPNVGQDVKTAIEQLKAQL